MRHSTHGVVNGEGPAAVTAMPLLRTAHGVKACNNEIVATPSVGKRLAQWTRTKRGAASLFVFIVALGVGLIALGDVLTRWSDYNRSIFAALGTALVLIAPLAAGERLLRTIVEDAKDAADQARQSAERAQHVADSLQEQLSDLLNQSRLEVAEREQRASNGNFTSLVSLYDEAHKYGWIYDKGIRVETGFPGCNWAKMTVERGQTGEDIVRFSLEEEPFKPIDVSVDWTSAETAPEFLARVAQRLQQVNRAPSDAKFREPGLHALFAGALRKAIELHTSSDGYQGADNIILFIGDEWAVMRGGLFNLPQRWSIRQQDLKLVDPRLAQKPGLESIGADFLKAVDVAKKVQPEVRRDDTEPLRRFARSF